MGALTGFDIRKRRRDDLVHFELEDGQTAAIRSTLEQLDLIAEEIDRHLDSDEEEMLATDGET